jgi:hypothetical protein
MVQGSRKIYNCVSINKKPLYSANIWMQKQRSAVHNIGRLMSHAEFSSSEEKQKITSPDVSAGIQRTTVFRVIHTKRKPIKI